MLQAIRDRVTGVLAWIIVGLIAVTFALWGIDWYLKKDARVYAAKVNDVEIPVADYRRALQRQTDRLRATLGENFDSRITDDPAFKAQVLERLIEEALLVQAADEAGFAISDALLAARIQGIREFQVDGEFSPERYEAYLRRQGMAPATFESQLRRSLLVDQVIGGIGRTGAVTEQDVERALRLQQQQRRTRYVEIPVARFSDAVEVSEQEVAEFYQANKARFMEPEAVRLAYIELTAKDIKVESQPTEEEIQALYEARRDKLGTPEQRRVRHILIQVPQDASEEEVEAAREKAQKLLDRIQAGESFEELAKEYSDDPGSAAQGGDLGFFGRGVMVSAFEDAAFGLDKGQVSDLVRTPFGFHIIQVVDIKPGSVPPLDEVRDQLVDELNEEAAEHKVLDAVEQLSQLSFENPDTLDIAAEALGLKVKHSDWLPRGSKQGIAQYPAVEEAAYSDDVLEAGNNSEVLEVEPGHYVVLRVEEHKPSAQLPLEAVEDVIEGIIRTRKMRELAAEKGEQLLQALRGGESLDDLAEAEGLEVTDTGFVGHGNTGHPPKVLQQAFQLPRPDGGKPPVAGVALANGDFVLLELVAVKDGDIAAVSEEQRKAFRDNMDQLYGSMELAAFMSNLKANAVIERNLEGLQ